MGLQGCKVPVSTYTLLPKTDEALRKARTVVGHEFQKAQFLADACKETELRSAVGQISQQDWWPSLDAAELRANAEQVKATLQNAIKVPVPDGDEEEEEEEGEEEEEEDEKDEDNSWPVWDASPE